MLGHTLQSRFAVNAPPPTNSAASMICAGLTGNRPVATSSPSPKLADVPAITHGPNAGGQTPQAVAAAARKANLPPGSLPNGSGLRFGATGTRQAGWNTRAASVIWEWLRVDHEAVVWPPRLATAHVRLLSSKR